MPQYNKKNSLHVDDLSRNFAMNPGNGIKIKPFKNSKETKKSDRELAYLTNYLLKIADIDDVCEKSHKKWKKEAKKRN
jgi:ubiquitin-like domain-containing CTD phosphatase 1